MKVIVVANQKGGVGKSTISCNLAVCAALDGKKVMVIDADPQGSSMAWRSLREDNNVSAISITKPSIVKDIKNFENFDFVFVDAGGRDSSLFRAAVMTAANGLLLIPVLASGVDVWATEDTFQILSEARSIGAEIDSYAIFNQVKPKATLVEQAKFALAELTVDNNVTLLESQIGDREDFKKAFLLGKGVVEFAPKSKAAIELNKLYQELLQKLKGE